MKKTKNKGKKRQMKTVKSTKKEKRTVTEKKKEQKFAAKFSESVPDFVYVEYICCN